MFKRFWISWSDDLQMGEGEILFEKTLIIWTPPSKDVLDDFSVMSFSGDKRYPAEWKIHSTSGSILCLLFEFPFTIFI